VSSYFQGVFNANKRKKVLIDYMNKLVQHEYIVVLLLQDFNFLNFIAINHDVKLKLEKLRTNRFYSKTNLQTMGQREFE
jgi:hypothetical protein